MLSILIVNYADSSAIADVVSVVEYIVLMIKEFAVGVVLGFLITLFNFALTFGGEINDLQMGLSMSKVFDPASNLSLAFNGSMFNAMFMLIFIAVGGHYTLIQLFMSSGDLIPYGQVTLGPNISTAIIDVFKQCCILGIKLAMPVIAIEIIVEMGIGLIMKAVPQINVFVVNIQAKILIGFLMLAMLFVPIMSFVESVITEMFDAIVGILHLMA